jgi:glycosyltransferase involved in cell wall biosynthesis
MQPMGEIKSRTTGPRLSVVMASYNHAAFVRQAVDSVLAQSFADFEFVINDDASRDGTANVLRAVTDPRIRLHVFPENRGAVDALNDAITRSCGEYIAVLNSDDYFLPEKLARQVAYLDSYPDVGAVFGVPKVVDESGRVLGEDEHVFARLFTSQNRTRIEWLRYFFESGNCLCHPTVMIRRQCYDQVGLYDSLMMNLPDFYQWVRLCQQFDIHIMAEPVTAFRLLAHERNTSAPSPPNLARSAWETITVLERYLTMPAAQLEEVVRPWPENLPGRPPEVVLALVAVRIGRPGYVQFGLGLLRDCIRRNPDAFPIKEYFRLVGQLDPVRACPVAPPPRHTLPGFELAHKIIDRIRAWSTSRG